MKEIILNILNKYIILFPEEKECLDVHTYGDMVCITKEDYIRYLKREPEREVRNGILILVPVGEQIVKEICKNYGIKAQKVRNK